MPDVQTGSKSSKRPWQNMYHMSKMQGRVYKTKLVVGNMFGYITVNKKQIYFLGDSVKYSEQSLKDLEGIGAKTVDTVKEELAKYNLH